MPSLTIGRHSIVPGRHYNTPKEVWAFTLKRSSMPPEDIAREVLRVNADLIGLRGALRTLRRRRVIRSAGGWHVIFSQFLVERRVHRAYVTVHMNRHRQVYLVKNRAVPRDFMPRPADRHQLGLRQCERLALRALSRTTGPRQVRDREAVWFPVRDRLQIGRAHV